MVIPGVSIYPIRAPCHTGCQHFAATVWVGVCVCVAGGWRLFRFPLQLHFEHTIEGAEGLQWAEAQAQAQAQGQSHGSGASSYLYLTLGQRVAIYAFPILIFQPAPPPAPAASPLCPTCLCIEFRMNRLATLPSLSPLMCVVVFVAFVILLFSFPFRFPLLPLATSRFPLPIYHLPFPTPPDLCLLCLAFN